MSQRHFLWYRYLFSRFFTLTISLVLLCFFLFVFADLLTHIKDVVDPKTTWSTWARYYLCLFSYRLDVIIPFSIACATAIFLPRLIKNNELIALLNAGLSLKKIAAPFFLVSLLLTSILWINTQYFFPKATVVYHQITDSDFEREEIETDSTQIGIVLCKGGSRLFFSQHNPKKKQLADVFWVLSPDRVFHIERLTYTEDSAPQGYGIDLVERDSKGRMQKTESSLHMSFPDLALTAQEIQTAAADPKELSISQLAYLVPRFGSSHSERAIESTVTLYQKILYPLLALIAFLLPAPFCLRFESRLPQALLVFLSLASLFCFLLIAQAFVILTRPPLCLPTISLLIPWIVALVAGHRQLARV